MIVVQEEEASGRWPPPPNAEWIRSMRQPDQTSEQTRRTLVASDASPSSAAAAREILARAGGRELSDRLDTMVVERVDVAGDMLAGILRVAGQVQAQLIVVPNHGAPGSVRIFLPNLAEPLLLTARCSVLVVPDEAPVRS